MFFSFFHTYTHFDKRVFLPTRLNNSQSSLLSNFFLNANYIRMPFLKIFVISNVLSFDPLSTIIISKSLNGKSYDNKEETVSFSPIKSLYTGIITHIFGVFILFDFPFVRNKKCFSFNLFLSCFCIFQLFLYLIHLYYILLQLFFFLQDQFLANVLDAQ